MTSIHLVMELQRSPNIDNDSDCNCVWDYYWEPVKAFLSKEKAEDYIEALSSSFKIQLVDLEE